jgi:hypothetical protein
MSIKNKSVIPVLFFNLQKVSVLSPRLPRNSPRFHHKSTTFHHPHFPKSPLFKGILPSATTPRKNAAILARLRPEKSENRRS